MLINGNFTRTEPVIGVGGEPPQMAGLLAPRLKAILIDPTSWRTPGGTATEAAESTGPHGLSGELRGTLARYRVVREA